MTITTKPSISRDYRLLEPPRVIFDVCHALFRYVSSRLSPFLMPSFQELQRGLIYPNML